MNNSSLKMKKKMKKMKKKGVRREYTGTRRAKWEVTEKEKLKDRNFI